MQWDFRLHHSPSIVLLAAVEGKPELTSLFKLTIYINHPYKVGTTTKLCEFTVIIYVYKTKPVPEKIGRS